MANKHHQLLTTSTRQITNFLSHLPIDIFSIKHRNKKILLAAALFCRPLVYSRYRLKVSAMHQKDFYSMI
jgi:hypothetical protein